MTYSDEPPDEPDDEPEPALEDVEIPARAWLSRRDERERAEVTDVREVARIPGARVSVHVGLVSARRGRVFRRALLVVHRPDAPPLYVRFRDEDLPAAIAALEAARDAHRGDRRGGPPPEPTRPKVRVLPGERELSEDEALLCGIAPRRR